MLEMTRDALIDTVIGAEEGEINGIDVGKKHLGVGKNVGKNVGKKSQGVGKNELEIRGGSGSNLQEQVIALLGKDPSLSAAKLASILGLSTRHIERLFADLKESGRIERVGSRRGGHWVIKH